MSALSKYATFFRQSLLLLDVFITGLSFFVALFLRSLLLPIIPQAGDVAVENFYLHIVLICFVWWVILYFQEGYAEQRLIPFSKEIRQVGKTIFWGSLVLFSLSFFVHETTFPRSLFFIFILVNFVMLVAEKAFVHQFINVMRERGYNRVKVLLVGTGKTARQFVRTAMQVDRWGVDVIGFLAEDESKVGSRLHNREVIGSFDDLESVMHRYYIDEVIFATNPEDIGKIDGMFGKCKMEGVRTRIISGFLGAFVSNMNIDIKYGYPILTYSPIRAKEWQLVLKRAIDILISSVFLIPFTLIVLPIVSALIKLTSPGPLFYRWQVMGANKRRFTGYKFRTMFVDADEMKKKLMAQNEMSGPVFKMERDPRITPIGRYLRKLSIDELPQLWSVFKGDMSLVGPRPPLQTEVEHFESWHRRKLSVKPGITCLWQISGRNNISDFNEWVKLDLQYIDNWSLWLDLKILFKTIPVVLFGSGAR